MFGVFEGMCKFKLFVDYVMGFSVVDGKIWICNYEIWEVVKMKGDDGDEEEEGVISKKLKKGGFDSKEMDISLIEIGLRFVLMLIII